MKLIDTNEGSYVELSTHELLFLGMSGQPYRGILGIQFITSKQSIDFIELKKYVESLRRVHIRLEDSAKKIHDDIDKFLKNSTLKITVKTTPRGGFSSTIIYGNESHHAIEIKPIVFGG